MRASTKKNNFSGGELTPLLEGRNDLEAYQKGVAMSRNMQPIEQGGITRRPGTRYVNEVKDSNKQTRLIPFIVSEDISFIIEFGHNSIRVYKETQLVYGVSANILVNGDFDLPYAIGWSDVSSGTGSAVDNRGYKSVELHTTDAPGTGVGKIEQFVISGATIGNDYTLAFRTRPETTGVGVVNAYFGTGSFAGNYGILTLTAVPGFTGEGSLTFFSATSTTIGVSFEYDSFVTPGNFAMIDDISIVERSTVLEVATPYDESELFDIQFAQANDVMWLTHRNHPPQILTRIADDDWTLDEEVFDFGPFEPLVYREGTPSNRAQLTLGTTWLEGEGGIACDTGISGMDTVDYNGELFYLVSEDDPSDYAIVSLGTYSASTTFINCTLKSDVPASLQATTTRLYARQAWNSVDRLYPNAVGLYEQRLCFASSALNPQTLWASSSGGFTYFKPGVADDDSITYTLAGKKQNPIRWISDAENLVLGGMSGEWGVRGGGFGDPITPSNIIPRMSTKKGSASVSPTDIGNDIAFVQKSQHRILALISSEQGDYHGVIDLTILAEHLVSIYTIRQTSFSKEREPILYAVRSDGTLLGCTYNRDQNIIAWFTVETDGVIESVATIPKSTADQTYVVVKRVIDGSEVRYIEYIDELDWRVNNSPYYLDSGNSYLGAATDTISGLDHLEAETVSVYSSGEYIGDYTVTSGSITLDREVTQAHVGLNYSSRMEELPKQQGSPDGSSGSRQKRDSRVSVRLYKTQAIKINDDQFSLPRDNPSTAKPELFTGQIEDNKLGWDKDASNSIESVGPNPLTILSIDTTLTVGSE